MDEARVAEWMRRLGVSTHSEVQVREARGARLRTLAWGAQLDDEGEIVCLAHTMGVTVLSVDGGPNREPPQPSRVPPADLRLLVHTARRRRK